MSQEYLGSLFGLQGKNVVVTGAAGQLGQVFCRAFVAAGCRVYATDAVMADKGLFDAPQLTYHVLDIVDIEAVDGFFEGLSARGVHVDVLVNNAGVSVFEPFEERPEASFDWVMGVNLKGTFHCIRAYALQVKKTGKAGAIVNIGSIYGVVSPDPRIYTDCARKNSEVYGATKAGIIQMTKYFAVHLAPEHIRVNCVSPGGIFNPQAPQGEDFVKNYSARCPMGRMADAQDMVGAVLYLSSQAAGYTNGQNLVVDGGSSSW
ncbi:MAG: SDR family oxidoreductase [Candidatus Omnitrophota bacterium]